MEQGNGILMQNLIARKVCATKGGGREKIELVVLSLNGFLVINFNWWCNPK